MEIDWKRVRTQIIINLIIFIAGAIWTFLSPRLSGMFSSLWNHHLINGWTLFSLFVIALSIIVLINYIIVKMLTHKSSKNVEAKDDDDKGKAAISHYTTSSTGSGVTIGHLQGSINVGLSVVDVEKLLESQIRQITEKLISARKDNDESEVHILNAQIRIIESKLKDTTQALLDREMSLSQAQKAIKSFENKLPKHQLDMAERALSIGDTEQAERIFELISNEGGESIALASFHLGLIAEYRLDIHQAIQYYRKAASNSNQWNYKLAAGKMSSALGYYTESEDWLKQALFIAKSADDSRSISITLNELGLVHTHQEKFVNAEIELRESILQAESGFGCEHREVAVRYLNLAGLINQIRPSEDVSQLFENALLISQSLEETDILRMAVLNNYAGFHYHRGDFANAEKLYRKSIEETSNQFSREHVLVGMALNGLGEVHIQINNLKDAESELYESKSILENIYGESSIEVANVYNNIARLKQRQNLVSDCIQYHKKALSLREQFYGIVNLTVANSCNNLANAYFIVGDMDEAEKYALRARSIREALLGPTHTLLANTQNILGSIYIATREYDKAIDYLSRAVSIKELNTDATSMQVFPALNNLSLAYNYEGEYDLAESAARRAVRIVHESHSAPSLEMATALNTLGLALKSKMKLDEANECFSKALVIARESVEESHPSINEIRKNLDSI